MTKSYPADTPKLGIPIIEPETYAAMGELVMIFSAIDNLVNLYFRTLTGLNDSQMVVILGRQSITSKLAMCEYLARTQGEDALNIHKRLFGDAFQDIRTARNAIAHGDLFGMTADNELAFVMASETLRPNGDSAVSQVLVLHKRAFRQRARLATRLLADMVADLKLGPLIQKRQREATLGPHRKAKKQSRKQKPPDPPQS